MFLLKKLNKKVLIFPALLIGVVILLLPKIVFGAAGLDAIVVNMTSWIFNGIVYVGGQLLLIAINILIKVASFNDFVNANVVNIGWVIVRDIANMAIVIALLFIAYNTVLNKQDFSYQKMLPKLILAAIAVNFSKVILGIAIDVGQVVMMTFVHAFEDIAAGNLTYGFGLHDMLNVRDTLIAAHEGAGIDDWSVLGALVLASILVVVALGVVIAFIGMLLSRIIILWLSIIFSPFFFVAPLFPKGTEYIGELQQGFTKNVIFGPVLAFLFWLSMTVLSQITASSHLINLKMQSDIYLKNSGGSQVDYAYFASEISSPQRVFDYMVTVALLIGCLITAQKSGAAGAKFAGNVLGKLQGAGQGILKGGRKLVTGAITKPLGAAGRAIGRSNIVYNLKAHKTRFLDENKLGKGIKWFKKEEIEKRAETREAVQFSKHGGVKHKKDWINLQAKRDRERYLKSKEEFGLDKYKKENLLEDIKNACEPAEGFEKDLSKARFLLMEAARNKELNIERDEIMGLLKTYKGAVSGSKSDQMTVDYVEKNITNIVDSRLEKEKKEIERFSKTMSAMSGQQPNQKSNQTQQQAQQRRRATGQPIDTTAERLGVATPRRGQTRQQTETPGPPPQSQNI